jgi:uncharacterized protein (TIGR02001 family)
MKKTIITVFSTLLLASSVPAAVDVSVAYTSDYYFRGSQLADSIIEAAVNYSEENFYAGVWTAQPFEDAADDTEYQNEIDFCVGYGAAAGIASYDFGMTAYVYPELDEGDDSTYEAYAGVSLDLPAAPSLYVYYDVTLEVLTIEGGLSHSIELDETSTIDFSVSLGDVIPDEGDSGIYYLASLGYGLSIGETASFSASLNYTDGDDILTGGNWNDGFYFSVGLSVGF